MAVHVVTVIHRPQGVEEEAGGKENQWEYKETIKKRGKRRKRFQGRKTDLCTK